MLKSKNFLLTTLFSIIISTVALATDVELQLSENESCKKIRLPFSYRHLNTLEDKENTVYLPEEAYFFLKKDSPTRVLVGPLQPWLFIALSNLENGDTIIFHKHLTSSIEDALKKAKVKLEIKDPANIIGQIFTNAMPKYTDSCVTPFEKTTMQKLHENRTQKAEITLIKNKIVEYFKINKREQIKADIFSSKLKDFDLGNYELAELFVLVSGGLKLESICPMHEKVFGDFEKIKNIGKRVHAHNLSQNKIKNDIYQQNGFELSQSIVKENYLYGKRPFTEVIKEQILFDGIKK